MISANHSTSSNGHIIVNWYRHSLVQKRKLKWWNTLIRGEIIIWSSSEENKHFWGEGSNFKSRTVKGVKQERGTHIIHKSMSCTMPRWIHIPPDELAIGSVQHHIPSIALHLQSASLLALYPMVTWIRLFSFSLQAEHWAVWFVVDI